ncbi:Hypothetical protein NTJ_00559 [Nesidiocoris tenuis]|uniref:Uncharacterized protein n=1 Tax=Nesidiocoris tenuis TaxID=355587 RepID=A0ABN7A725_9HEMI|nr:Hypothetical protein NTJ_00559 [Nesidiocoris tenuis]
MPRNIIMESRAIASGRDHDRLASAIVVVSADHHLPITGTALPTIKRRTVILKEILSKADAHLHRGVLLHPLSKQRLKTASALHRIILPPQKTVNSWLQLL